MYCMYLKLSHYRQINLSLFYEPKHLEKVWKNKINEGNGIKMCKKYIVICNDLWHLEIKYYPKLNFADTLLLLFLVLKSKH